MQTPMNRMQEHFKKLNTLTTPLFHKVELSHKKSKYSRYANDGEGGHSKIVESDFIRIYKPSQGKDATSFAFAFNNYKTSIDNTIVTVSIKTAKTLEVVNLDFPTFFTNFKVYLEKIERLHASKKLSHALVVKNLKKVFPTSQEEEKIDYGEIITSLKDKTSANFVTARTEQNKQKALEKELSGKEAAIEKKLQTLRRQLEKEAGLPTLKRKVESAKNKSLEAQSELASELDKALSLVLKQHATTPLNRLKENLRKEISNRYHEQGEKFEVYELLTYVVERLEK